MQNLHENLIELQQELEQIKTAKELIIQANSQTEKTIIKAGEALSDFKTYYKSEAVEIFEKIDSIISEIDKLVDENRKLFNETEKKYTESVKKTTKSANDVLTKSENLVEKVISKNETSQKRFEDGIKKMEEIDFPTKFNNIDTSIRTTDLAMQNILSRLEKNENFLKTEFDKFNETNNQKFEEIKSILEKETEKIKFVIHIIIGITIVILAVLTLIK